MKDANGRAVTYDLVQCGKWDLHGEMEATPGGDYVDSCEYEELLKRIAALEAELAAAKLATASTLDLGNTYCREHSLPEAPDDPRYCIERLGWKCARLRQELSACQQERDKYHTVIKDLCAVLRDHFKDTSSSS